MKMVNAEYVATYNGIALAGEKGTGAISDHAVLVLDLTA